MSAENPHYSSPEFNINVGRVKAEVFDMQGILADAQKGNVNLYDSKDVYAPIEQVAIYASRRKLPSGESGFEYTGEIKLDPSIPQTAKIIEDLKTKYGKASSDRASGV